VTTFTQTAENTNYSAEVIAVHTLIDLPGLDNLKGIWVSGYQALVPATTPIGSIMVVFPAESRLSPEFLSSHNLYRHSDRNADPSKTGYIEDAGRVKAIRLRGNKSSALAMDWSEFIAGWEGKAGVIPPAVGTLFDTVDGVQFVKKYEQPRAGGPTAASSKAKIRTPEAVFPLHYDTENYFRNSDSIPLDTYITVSQKVHGTSVRFGRVPVERELRWFERILSRWIPVKAWDYEFVVGSRKVLKSVSGTAREGVQHYYGDGQDIWTASVAQYADRIPQGVLVFGELVGFTPNGAPIQKDYTYGAKPGEALLYVYRVAMVSPDGTLFDLAWDGVEQFCAEHGLSTVPVLWRGKHQYFHADAWLDTRFHGDGGFPQALPLSNPKTVDEGVVVRAEGMLPYALKVKSPAFLEWETKQLDAGTADTEAEG
jgi:hypothetical protein